MASALPQIDLSDLRQVHKLVSEKFPHDYLDVGLGAIGLFLKDPPKNAGYNCTPINSLSFAGLGVDGIHLSSITETDEINPLAPIVLTIPMAFDSPNFIVGENLYDFLCLGCCNGYANLANLHTHFNDTMEFFQRRYENTFDDRVPGILETLVSELELQPWSDVRQHFRNLQSRLMPKVRLADEQ